MDVDEIIKHYIKPRLSTECEKIGVPESFILSIYGCYSKPFEYQSKCYPEYNKSSGEIIGVHIRIGDINRNKPRTVLSDFRHELWHTKKYYCGVDQDKIKFEELRADLYAIRGSFGDFVSHIFHKSNN